MLLAAAPHIKELNDDVEWRLLIPAVKSRPGAQIRPAALLMFIGQLTAVGVLLVLAGITRLTAYPIQAIARSFNRPG